MGGLIPPILVVAADLAEVAFIVLSIHFFFRLDRLRQTLLLSIFLGTLVVSQFAARPRPPQPEQTAQSAELPFNPWQTCRIGDWAEYACWETCLGRPSGWMRLEVIRVEPDQVRVRRSQAGKAGYEMNFRKNTRDCNELLAGLQLLPCQLSRVIRVRQESPLGLALVKPDGTLTSYPGLENASLSRLNIQQEHSQVKFDLCQQLEGIQLVGYSYQEVANGRATQVDRSFRLAGRGRASRQPAP